MDQQPKTWGNYVQFILKSLNFYLNLSAYAGINNN